MRDWHSRFDVDGTDATLMLRKLRFRNLRSASSGGAIEIGSHSQTGVVKIMGSAFDQIQAQMGGAVSMCGGTLDVTDSTFSQGSATSNLAGFGGIIRAGYGTGSQNLCTDKDGMSPTCAQLVINPAVIANGGCTIDMGLLGQTGAAGQQLGDPGWCPDSCGKGCCPPAVVSLQDSTFSDSEATSKGGAVYVYGALNVGGCTFRNSHADVGGAIFAEGGALAVTETLFSGNGALQGYGDAVIYNLPPTGFAGEECVNVPGAHCWCDPTLLCRLVIACDMELRPSTCYRKNSGRAINIP